MFGDTKQNVRIFHNQDDGANLSGGSSLSPEVDYSALITSLQATYSQELKYPDYPNNLKALSASVKGLLSRRDFNHAHDIDPASIFPDYADYYGTFNVSHAHIAQIVPGYQTPSVGLLEERKQIQQAVYGSMPASESSVAIEIVRAMQPRTIFEIGTHRGYLMKALMEASPNDTFGISIDLPSDQWDDAVHIHDKTQYSYTKNCPPEAIGEAVLATPEVKDRVALLRGDSAKFHFEVLRGTMDIVVVDGNHNYDAARADLQMALALVSKGGVILIDDVNKPFRLEGVTLAVLEQTYHNHQAFYFANHKDGPDGCLAFHVGS